MGDAQPSRRVEDAWAALRAGSAHDQTAKKVLQRYYGDADRQPSDCRGQRPAKQPAGAVPAKPAAEASGHIKAAPEEPEAAITTGLERSVQLLSNTGPSVRKTTLQRLQAACSSAAPEQAAHALTEGLGKALLLRFEDTSEACRELAVGCFQQLLIKGEEATLHLLPYAMPVLEERLQLLEGRPREGSEEVRLQLVTLLAVLVRQAGAAVGAYLAEVVVMVAAALADGYHEVNLLGCSVVQSLIDILGQRLQPVSKQLVADVLPLTTHTRFRVRVVALQTLTPLMHLGAHEMILEMVAWRDPNMVPIAAFYGDDLKVNFCGKLASDPHTAVRAAFVAMIGNWMLTLTERMDHEGRLLPYVLSALCDEAPAVRDAAVKLLEQLGELFEKDHQKDLIEELEYLHMEGAERPCAAAVCWGQQPDAAGTQAASCSSGSMISRQQQQAGQGQAADPPAAPVFHLPGPFSSRPRLGSRFLVQQNFSRVVGALVADVASWQAGPREAAVKLLLVQLVLMEETVSQHLHTLLPAMVKAMSAPDIAATVEQCAEVMGCFADFSLLLELLQPLVTEAAAAPGVQADALTLLAACIRGGLYGTTLPGHTPAILQLLSQGTLATSLDVRLNQASLAVLSALVEGLAQPVGLQQAAAVVQLLLGVVPWELASTAAITAGSGALVVASQQPAASTSAAAVGCGGPGLPSQQRQHGAQAGAASVQAVLAMCEQLNLGASSASSSSPEGLARSRLRQCEEVLGRLAARCQLPGTAQLLQVVAPQVLEQMEVGTWAACMPSPREVGRLCYLALTDPSAAPLLLQGGPLWAAAPPVAAGPYPVPADWGAVCFSESATQAATTDSSSSSSECASAVIQQMMQWLAHSSVDSSQQEVPSSQGAGQDPAHVGVLPDSSCGLLLTAFDLVLQQEQQQGSIHQQHQQQGQLGAGLVCLLQDSKTQLAGLRCCHWLLAGSSSNSAAGWAASWCWQHCGCLVQILQGHSPLLQAWACQVLLDLARAQQQPTTAAAEPGQGPLPGAAVRGLAGALDAANGRVRCAAAAVLVEVLGVGGSGDQVAAAAEPGESWVQVRQEALKALQGAGDVVAAAGLQAQTEALGCQ